jgi:hypothetical protein
MDGLFKHTDTVVKHANFARENTTHRLVCFIEDIAGNLKLGRG